MPLVIRASNLLLNHSRLRAKPNIVKRQTIAAMPTAVGCCFIVSGVATFSTNDMPVGYPRQCRSREQAQPQQMLFPVLSEKAKVTAHVVRIHRPYAGACANLGRNSCENFQPPVKS